MGRRPERAILVAWHEFAVITCAAAMVRLRLLPVACGLMGCATILGADFDRPGGAVSPGDASLATDNEDGAGVSLRDAAPIPREDPPIPVGPDGKCPGGYHLCGTATEPICASDKSVLSCGSSCAPCQVPEHAASATCASGACGFSCDPGFVPSGASCQAMTTTTCYRDADGDDYGLEATTKVVSGATCPPGYTLRGAPFDCDDESKDAHPGQTAYFDVPHGSPPSFDYDCNGAVSKTTEIADRDAFPSDCSIKITSSCAAASVADNCRCLLQVGSTSCGTNATGLGCLFTDDFTACVPSGGLLSVGYAIRCH